MHSTLHSTLQMNQPVPDFSLPDQNGQLHRLSEYRGKLVIVNFWSAECPWSERADKSLAVLQDRFPGQVVVLPIASNVNESDEMVNEAIHQWGALFYGMQAANWQIYGRRRQHRTLSSSTSPASSVIAARSTMSLSARKTHLCFMSKKR
jgi:thiol-disulfide isomerase/thioredoxin